MPPSAVADPQLLLLISLASGPKHGHAMRLDIEAFADRRLGPGTLYGALTILEGGPCWPSASRVSAPQSKPGCGGSRRFRESRRPRGAPRPSPLPGRVAASV